MEPITLLGILFSVLSYLKGEADEAKSRDFDAYLDWVRRQEYKQLVDLILGNEELTRSLRDLIERHQGHMIELLTNVDRHVCSIASRIPELQPLANAIGVESRISDQAVSILRQMNEAEAAGLLVIKDQRHANYTLTPFMDNPESLQSLEISEPRFIDDDLLTLVMHGLLREDYHNKDRLFLITHAGAIVGG